MTSTRTRRRNPRAQQPSSLVPIVPVLPVVVAPGTAPALSAISSPAPSDGSAHDAAWAMFARCFDGPDLVPPRSTPAVDDAVLERLSADQRWALRQVQTFDDLAAKGWADNTRRSYGWHARKWGEWCSGQGIAPLPLDPEQVTVHLMGLALVTDTNGEYARDQDGQLMHATLMPTIEGRLQALNLLARFTGHPAPGDAPAVQALMRGLRRLVGVRARRRKQAVDHDLLKAMLTALEGWSAKQARNRLLVALRHATGLSPQAIAALTWFDVTLESDVAVLATKRGPVRVPRANDGGACAVELLSQARAVATRLDRLDGPVVPGVGGVKPMTRQAINLAAAHVLSELSTVLNRPVAWTDLPNLERDLFVQGFTGLRTADPTLAQIRNRAMLLTAWHTALRRSNVVMLRWGDVTFHSTGVVTMLNRRSKTDQEGVGHISRLSPSPDPSVVPCPVDALLAWQSALTEALGRPPASGEPVFPLLTKSGVALGADGRLRGLQGEVLNELVQDLVVAAGACSKSDRLLFGAHSLRAGFITEGLRDGKLSIAEIQEVSGHKQVDVLLQYRREVEQNSRNSSSVLMSRMVAQTSSAPATGG